MVTESIKLMQLIIENGLCNLGIERVGGNGRQKQTPHFPATFLSDFCGGAAFISGFDLLLPIFLFPISDFSYSVDVAVVAW